MSVRWADGGGFAIIPEWLLDSDASDRSVRLFAILGRYADKNGHAFPSKKTLAERLDCVVSTLDAALDDLKRVGAVTTQARRRDDGSLTSNEYTLHAVRLSGDDPLTAGGGHPASRVTSSDPADVKEREPLNESQGTREDLARIDQPVDVSVRQTWATAPGMIQHRDSYFDEKMRRKITNAISKYGADDVCKAIDSYAFVLGSQAHFWNHRWTLGDFLTRGLDRFVPEAEPERVFATTAKSGPGGNFTPEEMMARAQELHQEGR